MEDRNFMTDELFAETMLLAKVLNYPEERDMLRLEDKHFSEPRHGAIYDKIVNDNTFTKELLLNDSLTNPERYGNYDFVQKIVNFPIPTKHGVINDQKTVYRFYCERKQKKVMQEYLQSPKEETALKVYQTIKERSEERRVGKECRAR